MTGKRPRLTDDQKHLVVEGSRAGASNRALATRFGVSMPTIAKVILNAPRPVVEPELSPEPALTAQADLITKLYGLEDIGVFFQQEHIIIRIPNKTFVQTLLKDHI